MIETSQTKGREGLGWGWDGGGAQARTYCTRQKKKTVCARAACVQGKSVQCECM
jgi:hypothetical protein